MGHDNFPSRLSPRPGMGVKYVSYYGALGYFVAAKRYMLGLSRMDLPLTWTPMLPDEKQHHVLHPFTGNRTGDRELDPLCNAPVDYDTVILHIPPDLFPRWFEQERGKRILCYTVWETDRLPPGWPALLNQTSHVLVPSQWNWEVFRRNGVTSPITVVPHIPETNHDQNKPAFRDLSPADYVFYTVESWTARKAVWDTIRCYLRAFTATDPVVLVIKTNRVCYGRPLAPAVQLPGALARLAERIGAFLPGPYQKTTVQQFLRRILREHRDPARILLIIDELTEEEIHRLHGRGDCYVSLSHSEGWGLGVFEAAHRGKPVIITGYGGQRDFLPEDLAYLLPYTMVPARDETGCAGLTSGQRWSQPSLPDAVRLMKYVFENRDEARARSRKLGDFVRTRFDGDETIRRLLSVIREERRP